MGGPGLSALLLFCWAGATWAELDESGRIHRGVDLILDCSLAKDDGHHWGLSASKLNMAPATLVLKQVPVPDDGMLDGFTDFPGVSEAQGDTPIAFEASVDQVQLPHAEVLLHAACQEKVVTCELSHLPQTGQEATSQGVAYFISSIQGTVLASVEFQVMTQTPSVQHSLGAFASLHCGFSVAPGSGPLQIEWRWQHQGQGRRVYSWEAGKGQALRAGAWMASTELLEAGNASLALPDLTLRDEGTYICQISTHQHQAQQIIHLSILETPKVRLNLVNEASSPTLFCSMTGYYPLDVSVSWSREEPGGSPTSANGAYFSNHRQSSVGTYSLSSSLQVEPSPKGATYRCQVSHVSLTEPIVLEIWVAPPEKGASMGFFIATGLFFLALLFLGFWRCQAIHVNPKSHGLQSMN
ncbi:tapasin-related protein isoform X2 [Dromiciops gliroides]|uniref:tapasin-related protein isoform X2 n=1 Tax=Dromiciops gliroides TaxID=33562 RepID=UPI001CC70F11|nr:tapasin-related protein isoform X2 [Dromiciops gliroides]